MINNITTLDKATHERARRLIACANLQMIRFAKFGLVTDLTAGNSSEEVELSTQSKSDGHLNDRGMTLVFDLRVRGKAGDRVVVDVSGRLEAIYELPDNERPDATDIRAFAKTNGMLNVWPYWREYVQSATIRAGLPPLTLPLFRVVYDQPKK